MYIICKYNNEEGPNIAIYPFDIKSGKLEEFILKESLVSEIDWDPNYVEIETQSVT